MVKWPVVTQYTGVSSVNGLSPYSGISNEFHYFWRRSWPDWWGLCYRYPSSYLFVDLFETQDKPSYFPFYGRPPNIHRRCLNIHQKSHTVCFSPLLRLFMTVLTRVFYSTDFNPGDLSFLHPKVQDTMILDVHNRPHSSWLQNPPPS